MLKKYYVDACIWINLLKKEGDASKGKPYWQIAKEFLEKNNHIIISTIVLKELKYILKEKFSKFINIIKDLENTEIIKTNEKDYDFARDLENKINFKIGFYDCIHIAICKRLNFILITRDRDLIEVAKEIIIVFRPELIN